MGMSLDELGRERFHVFEARRTIKKNYPDWLYWYSQNPAALVRILCKTIYLKNPTEFFCCYFLKNQSCSDSSISFHYMSPEAMAKIYELWLKYKNKNEIGFNLSTITDKIDF